MAPMVDLGAWVPDQPSVENAGLRVAYNTLPAERGYDSLPALVATGAGSINATCVGAMTGRARLGTNFTVAGSANRLYLATTGSLSNVSNGGGSPYTLTDDNWWSFALFGNRVVASSYTDAPESFVIGTSSDFDALSADAPNAKHLTVVKDFVVAGNIIGRGANATDIGTAEDAVQWCALDDPTSWPQVGTLAAKSVQSDWQPLSGNGGQVTSLVGGSDYGIVFQERAIWRMDYEGGDTFFRFTPIDENRGCWIHKAAIRVGGVTYFPAEDGFMATDGMQTVPIGNEVVDAFFLNELAPDTSHKLSVTYFPEWKCIAWLFMGTDAVDGIPNTILFYNTQSQRWSYSKTPAEWLLTVLPFSVSLDDDATSLDSGTYASVSLDSLTGVSRRSPGAFNGSHALATFTSDPLTAVFETKEFEPEPGMVGTVLSIRPVYDSTTASFTAAAKTRMRMSDSQSSTDYTSPDATGKCAVRATGRYLAASFITSGQFKNFRGFDVDLRVRGAR